MGSLSIKQLDYLRIGANGPNPLLVPEGQKHNSETAVVAVSDVSAAGT